MVGLKRPRKQTTKIEERRPQPLVTPRQRILQQQWSSSPQPTTPWVPPMEVRLPQGTQISLVPKHKKKRSKTVVSRENGTLAVGNQRGSDDELLQEARDTTLVPVPPLLSPMSNNNDDAESDGRGKMADPTPSKQANDESIELAHTSSTTDAPPKQRGKKANPQPIKEVEGKETAHALSTGDSISQNVVEEQPPAPPVQLTVVADVHEQRNESQLQADMPPVAVGDNNEQEIVLSQDEEDHRLAEMVRWKSKCCEKIETNNVNIALLQQEEEVIRARRRDIEMQMRAFDLQLQDLKQQRAEEERCREKWLKRLDCYKTLFK